MDNDESTILDGFDHTIFLYGRLDNVASTILDGLGRKSGSPPCEYGHKHARQCKSFVQKPKINTDSAEILDS